MEATEGQSNNASGLWKKEVREEKLSVCQVNVLLFYFILFKKNNQM